MIRTVLSTSAAVAAIILAPAAFADDAEPRTRNVEGTYTGADGQVYTYEGGRTVQQGQADRTFAVTGPEGNTRAYESQRLWDREAGTSSFSSNVTGTQGFSRSFDEQTQWDRDAGTASRTRAWGFNDGTTRNSSTNVQRLENGRERTDSVTGRRGETRSRTKRVTRN